MGAAILDFAGTMERWQRVFTSKDRFIQTYLRYAVGNSDQNYTNYFLKFLSEKSKTIKFLLRFFHFLEYTTSGYSLINKSYRLSTNQCFPIILWSFGILAVFFR